MVRLGCVLASAVVLPLCSAVSSCTQDDEVCTNLDAATAGASQLQVKADSRSSRGTVVDQDENVEAETGALDFGGTALSSLSSGEQLHAAAAEVRQAESKMKEQYSPSVNEIDNLINGFEGHVSESEDKCSTQLYELKHQLTLIREEVSSITVEVNSAEASIYTYEEACKEKTTEISIIETSKKKKTTKCVTEKKTEKKTLSVLKADMVQMKQISAAHIHVSGGVSGGGYGGGGGYGTGGGGYGTGGYRLSLLEQAQHAEPDDDVGNRQQRADRVQSMVQKTKAIAERANQCMAAAKKQGGEKAAPEQAAEAPEGNTAEVFLEIGHQENKTSRGSPLIPCNGIKPRCHPVSCVNGEWKCGDNYDNNKCNGIVPRCHPVSCINGEWVCGDDGYPSECKSVIIELEHTFTTSYVSLTRLIEEYEVTTHSTVCEQSVETEYNKEVNVVQTEANKVCKRVQVLIMNLNQYKLQLTQTTETKHTIETNLQVLIQQCGSLTETEGYLTEVTGTLTALGNCPGLDDLTFSLPTFVGEWAVFKQEGGMSDYDIDAQMTKACQSRFAYSHGKGVRPAETAELDEQSIQGMPKTNTADKPLMGACPMCEGDDVIIMDVENGNRHGRICWDPDTVIGPDTKRGDCHSGQRAVMCVYEPTPKPKPQPYKPIGEPLEPYEPVVQPPQPYKPVVQPPQPYKPVVQPPQPYKPVVQPPQPYVKPYHKPSYRPQHRR